MNTADEFAFASVRELRDLLRERKVSSLELARAALAQLDGAGRALRAVAEITELGAERDARAADRSLRLGGAGPLCGIPYGAKDVLDTAGIPTRWGSRSRRGRVPVDDATVIRRMREAGAVLVAKLSMIELAGAGGYANAAASIDGACLNPWDHSRWSGGSSSGSGAAVAAGFVPIALGSETGGSLVIPAAFCGLTTIRPSFGRVSRHGAMELSWSMDKIGPLAHTAEDCATVLRVIEGPDGCDFTVEDLATPVQREPLRIGVLRDGPDVPLGTAVAFEHALETLRGLGMRVSEAALPAGPYVGAYSAIMSAELALAHADLISGSDLDTVADPAQRRGLRDARSIRTADYAAALRTRDRLARGVRMMFSHFDSLVSPTVLTEATLLDEDLLEYRAKRRGGHAFLGAIAGVPAVSVPMGFGPSGAPLGLAITGDVGADRSILQIAAQFQRVTDWHRRRPASDAA